MPHEQQGYVMLHPNTPRLSLQFANRWDAAPVVKQAYFHPTAVTWPQQTC